MNEQFCCNSKHPAGIISLDGSSCPSECNKPCSADMLELFVYAPRLKAVDRTWNEHVRRSIQETAELYSAIQNLKSALDCWAIDDDDIVLRLLWRGLDRRIDDIMPFEEPVKPDM